MDYDKVLIDVRDYLAERVGDHVAGQLVGLARPGFTLEVAEPGEATGGCRFGGRALLEPGTPWPWCEDMPLSLLAVLDADALAPWLSGTIPAGTGLLNFFHLDTESEDADPRVFELSLELGPNDPRLGAVIPAASGRAEEVVPPARSTVFEPVAWTAVPGVGLPDLNWDPAAMRIDLGPDAGEIDRILPGSFIDRSIEDWDGFPARIDGTDVAFGWPEFPTSNLWMFPDGEDPREYHQLLQLSGNDQWMIGGDGGWTHYSIPTRALRDGDFSRAIPTPQIW